MKLRIDSKIKKGLALKMCDMVLDIIKLVFGGIILTGIMGLVDNLLIMIVAGFVLITLLLALAAFLYIIGNQHKI